MNKPITAPLAIIRFDGVAIGKMQNITIDEAINRQVVRGIGNLEGSEAPALTYEGSLNCSYYLIDYAKALNNLQKANVMLTEVQSVEQFVNTILLNTEGVQCDLMVKVPGTTASNGVITPSYEPIATVTKLFITRKSMTINEGQIAGANSSFLFLDPIIKPS